MINPKKRQKMADVVYHEPALLAETIAAMKIVDNGSYVDATFGGGGHSRAIVECLSAKGHLYSFDQDEDAAANAFDDPPIYLCLQ